MVELLTVVGIITLLAGLLLGWAFSAQRKYKVHATEAAMNNLLLVAETVRHVSPVFPDHRLANYFYVQPHTAAAGVVPTWSGTNYRRMGSGEFFVFLATLVRNSESMANSLGKDYLVGSPVPASWGVSQDAGGVLVDVFEQDPGHPNALDKDAASTSFYLASASDGYRLRMPVDAWGNPLAYRLYTHRDDLNQADTDSAPAVAGGFYRIRENIIQDEQFTRDRYVADGVAVDSPTATATTAEYVRPAVPSYSHPMWLSPGPDGKWGRFTDLPTDGVAPNYLRDATADAASSRDADGKDNIYSQETGR